MKNLTCYEEFNSKKYSNENKINEGILRRVFFKSLFFFINTIFNIKEFFTDKNYSSYKIGYVSSNLIDFLIPLKKNPDLMENSYFFKMYEEKYGKTILDDIIYIENTVKNEIKKLSNKENNIKKDIDPFDEEDWDEEDEKLNSKKKSKLSRLKKILHGVEDFRRNISDFL